MICNVCQELCSSRNKLFSHLRSHDPSLHAGLRSEDLTRTTCKREEVKMILESEDFKIVEKPQGLPTMGAARAGDNLLQHTALLIPERFSCGGKYRKAVPCHRLDAATGGLIVCSKSKSCEILMNQCFRRKLILKKYVSIVSGELARSQGVISSIIDGKRAITYYAVQSVDSSKQYGVITTVYLYPITGRKHQLRKQLKNLGHAIIGDSRFSQAHEWPRLPEFHRLFLWAIELQFPKLDILKKNFPNLSLPAEGTIVTADKLVGIKDQDEGIVYSAVDENYEDDYDSANASEDSTQTHIYDTATWVLMNQQRSARGVFSASQFIHDFHFEKLLRYSIDPTKDLVTVSISEPSFFEQFRISERKQ